VALPFTIFKKYLIRQKRRILWKLKYFTMQKYNLQKKKSSKKRNQIPSRCHDSITTNLKVSTQAKIPYHLSKIRI